MPGLGVLTELTSPVDHCVTSLLGSTNKTASVMVIKEALERMNPAIPMETYQ